MPSPSESDNDEPHPRLRKRGLSCCPHCGRVAPAEPDPGDGMEQMLECRGCGSMFVYRDACDAYDIWQGATDETGQTDLEEVAEHV
jgi:flavoprotein